MLRPSFPTLLCLGLLAACARPDDADYPRLLPLSELNAPPAIPAHAADAAADPQAVGTALDARRAEAEARAGAARRPVAGADALAGRAGALRKRADALARTELPPSAPTPVAAAPDAAPDATAPAEGADPDAATDARARALRERARALGDQPIAAPPPPCPPGTDNHVAARCTKP